MALDPHNPALCAVQGQILRLSERREAAIYLRDGKLWVAAIDLNAPAGTDPSHPAFYLPAQELLAGNSRGYWVVDPCHVDLTSCETGDECCGGFCRPAPGDGTRSGECT